jgi:hypothetical protein
MRSLDLRYLQCYSARRQRTQRLSAGPCRTLRLTTAVKPVGPSPLIPLCFQTSLRKPRSLPCQKGRYNFVSFGKDPVSGASGLNFGISDELHSPNFGLLVPVDITTSVGGLYPILAGSEANWPFLSLKRRVVAGAIFAVPESSSALGIGVALLIYLRKRRWIGDGGHNAKPLARFPQSIIQSASGPDPITLGHLGNARSSHLNQRCGS